MSSYAINGLPGMATDRQTTPYEVLAQTDGAIYLPGGARIIDGTKSRDTGQAAADISILRPGTLMGKVTSGGKYANSVIGVLNGAYAGTGTSITVAAAVVTELVRRVGASGTFTLTGPPTANGTYRSLTVTYSAASGTTITVTAVGVNEVQTIAVDTIMSGGQIGISAIDKNGVLQNVNVAYTSSWTATVAAIQTALIALLGTSAVACAVTNTHDMTITFSGTGYAALPQQAVQVDITGATGPTKVTVTRTTPGVDGRFVDKSFIGDTDGSQNPLAILNKNFGLKDTDVDNSSLDQPAAYLLIAGNVRTGRVYAGNGAFPTDTGLINFIKDSLAKAGKFIYWELL